MIIREIENSERENGVSVLSAAVTYETPVPRSFRVYFELIDAPGPICSRADPFLIGFLFPAMLLGEDIQIEGEVDPELLATIRRNVVPLVRRWCPYLSDVAIRCDEASPSTIRQNNGGSVLAFSGGLDACYTAVKHLDKIDSLVVSWGFDVRSHQKDLWERTLPVIQSVADLLEKPLCVVHTNIREVSHYQALRTRRGKINPHYFTLGRSGPNGPFLASIGRCLAPFASRYWIGASNTYDMLYPFGTHPLLDPMWSTPEQEVLHDGCEAGRSEKFAFLLEHRPSLLGKLRVCWLPGPGELNCSRCEKCLRSMAELRLNHAEEQATAFKWPLDLEAVARLKVRRRAPRKYWLQLREKARERGDTELERAIRGALGSDLNLQRFLEALPRKRNDERLAREHWKYVRRFLKPPEGASGEIPVGPETPPEKTGTCDP